MNFAQTVDPDALTAARPSWLAAIAQIRGEPAPLPNWIVLWNPGAAATVRRLGADDPPADEEE